MARVATNRAPPTSLRLTCNPCFFGDHQTAALRHRRKRGSTDGDAATPKEEGSTNGDTATPKEKEADQQRQRIGGIRRSKISPKGGDQCPDGPCSSKVSWIMANTSGASNVGIGLTMLMVSTASPVIIRPFIPVRVPPTVDRSGDP